LGLPFSYCVLNGLIVEAKHVAAIVLILSLRWRGLCLLLLLNLRFWTALAVPSYTSRTHVGHESMPISKSLIDICRVGSVNGISVPRW
jgi:hypothetical protein